MTLNITVATPRCIYQSADYRLLDSTSGQLTDFDIQKIVLTNNFRWTATICFAGVGRTHRVDVGTWLAERIAIIQPDDPLERLFEELTECRRVARGRSFAKEQTFFQCGRIRWQAAGYLPWWIISKRSMPRRFRQLAAASQCLS